MRYYCLEPGRTIYPRKQGITRCPEDIKIQLSCTVQAVHDNICKVLAMTGITFSQQVNLISGRTFLYSCLAKHVYLKKTFILSSCEHMTLSNGDSTDRCRIIKLVWFRLFQRCAITLIFQSAQTLVIKLWDFITICQLWNRCLLEQETWRSISLESSTITIYQILWYLNH